MKASDFDGTKTCNVCGKSPAALTPDGYNCIDCFQLTSRGVDQKSRKLRKTSVTVRWRTMVLKYQYESKAVRRAAQLNFIRECTDEELERGIHGVQNDLAQAAAEEQERRMGR